MPVEGACQGRPWRRGWASCHDDVVTSTRRITLVALLAAAASSLQILEAPLPRVLPWAKLGLANGATLFALIVLGPLEACWVVVLRQLLAGLILGHLMAPAFWMGLAGATAGGLAMALALWTGRRHLGLFAISIFGALANNLAQLAVAHGLLVRHGAVWWNLPPMLLASIPAGALVAWLTQLALRHLPQDLRPQGLTRPGGCSACSAEDSSPGC